LFCALGILLIPLPDLADGSQGLVTSISFEQIEEEVGARNPGILQRQSDFEDNGHALHQAMKNIKEQITMIEQNIADLQALQGALDPSDPLYTVYDTLIALLQGNIISLNSQKASISATDASLETTELNLEKAKDQTIVAAEGMYILYNNLNTSLNDLNKQREKLNELISVLNLQNSLGMITETDVVPGFQMSLLQAQTRLKDIELGITTVNYNMSFAARELNYMLGQDTTSALNIGGLPALDFDEINGINFDRDYPAAVVESYEVRIQQATNDSEDMMNDAQRSFNAGFFNVYNAVINSKQTLENTKAKLKDEQNTLAIVKLKYDLGIASKLEYDMENYNLAAAESAVKTDEAKLFKAYRDYQWAMRGLLPAMSAVDSQ
jgi:outer membrane protein TolC